MKTASKVLAVVAVICLGMASAEAGYINVTAEETNQMMQEDSSIALLDVRPFAEYELGHVPGAMSMPLAELEARMDELDRTADTIVYCQTGVRSEQASNIFQGPESVYNMLGGINAWVDAGFPVLSFGMTDDGYLHPWGSPDRWCTEKYDPLHPGSVRCEDNGCAARCAGCHCVAYDSDGDGFLDICKCECPPECVPEPATLPLLTLGGAVLISRRRRS